MIVDVVHLVAQFVLISMAGFVAVKMLRGEHADGMRRRVIVNLDDGSAIDGVLLHRHASILVLADATMLLPSAEPRRVDGQVVVERSKVAFIQVVS